MQVQWFIHPIAFPTEDYSDQVENSWEAVGNMINWWRLPRDGVTTPTACYTIDPHVLVFVRWDDSGHVWESVVVDWTSGDVK